MEGIIGCKSCESLKTKLMEIPDTSEREADLEQAVIDVQTQLNGMTEERNGLQEDKAVMEEHFLNIAVKDTETITKLREVVNRKTIHEIQDHIFEINRNLKHLESGNVAHNKPSLCHHISEIDKTIKKINKIRLATTLEKASKQ